MGGGLCAAGRRSFQCTTLKRPLKDRGIKQLLRVARVARAKQQLCRVT